MARPVRAARPELLLGSDLEGQQREWAAAVRLSGQHLLALTANAMLEDRQRCLEAGMTAFIPKPFTFEHLRTVVGAALAPGPAAPVAATSTSTPR